MRWAKKGRRRRKKGFQFPGRHQLFHLIRANFVLTHLMCPTKACQDPMGECNKLIFGNRVCERSSIDGILLASITLSASICVPRRFLMAHSCLSRLVYRPGWGDVQTRLHVTSALWKCETKRENATTKAPPDDLYTTRLMENLNISRVRWQRPARFMLRSFEPLSVDIAACEKASARYRAAPDDESGERK